MNWKKPLIFICLCLLGLFLALGIPGTNFSTQLSRSSQRLNPHRIYQVEEGQPLTVHLPAKVNYLEQINPDSLNEIALEVNELKKLKALQILGLSEIQNDPLTSSQDLRFILTEKSSDFLYAYSPGSGTIFTFKPKGFQKIDFENYLTESQASILTKNLALRDLNGLAFIDQLNSINLRSPYVAKLSDDGLLNINLGKSSSVSDSIIAYGEKTGSKITYLGSILIQSSDTLSSTQVHAKKSNSPSASVCCSTFNKKSCPSGYSGKIEEETEFKVASANECKKKSGKVIQTTGDCNSKSLENFCKKNKIADPAKYICCISSETTYSCPPPDGYTGNRTEANRQWIKAGECKTGQIDEKLSALDCLDLTKLNCKKNKSAQSPATIAGQCCTSISTTSPCPVGFQGEIKRVHRYWSVEACPSDAPADKLIDPGECYTDEVFNCSKAGENPAVVVPAVPSSTPKPENPAVVIPAVPSPTLKPKEEGTQPATSTPAILKTPSLVKTVPPMVSSAPITVSIPSSQASSASAAIVVPISSSSASSSVASNSGSSATPSPEDPCCICQYGYRCTAGGDAHDQGVEKKDCETLLSRNPSCKKSIVVESGRSKLLEAVCECKKENYSAVNYFRVAHGGEDSCARPFEDTEFILENMQCSNLRVVDVGCQVFTDADKAYKYALQLKNKLTKCCNYDTDVTIVAGQTNNSINRCASDITFNVCLKDGKSELSVKYDNCAEPAKGETRACWADSKASNNDSYCQIDGEIYKQSCALKSGCSADKNDCTQANPKCCPNGTQQAPVKVDKNKCMIGK